MRVGRWEREWWMMTHVAIVLGSLQSIEYNLLEALYLPDESLSRILGLLEALAPLQIFSGDTGLQVTVKLGLG